MRVCYVVSYFHPFASGAEGQELAQGLELARRGHVVHVVTRAVPGYPVDDEDYHGVFIHRWIRTAAAGPLFGLSFVSGVIAALRRLRPEIDVIHTHQGLWEAVATGLARPLLLGLPTLVQPASSGYYGEADELRRTRGAGLLLAILANTAFAAISADIEHQWRDLGVTDQRMIRMVSGVDAAQFRPGEARSRRLYCHARAWSSQGGSIPRRTSRSCSKPGRRSLGGRRLTSSWWGRATIVSTWPNWPGRWASTTGFSSPAPSITPPNTSGRRTFLSSPAWRRA